MDSQNLGRYAKAKSVSDGQVCYGIIAGYDGVGLDIVYLRKVNTIVDEADFWSCSASSLIVIDETSLPEKEESRIIDYRYRRELESQKEIPLVPIDDLVHSVVEEWSLTQSDKLSKLIMDGITDLNERLGGATPSDVYVYLGDFADRILDLRRSIFLKQQK